MPTPVSGQVGEQILSNGVGNVPFRQIATGEQAVSQVHARYYEQNRLGRIYSGGMTLTSISNTTFTVNTLGATCTPIAGVYNPTTSLYNLVILQAFLGVTITAATNTGGGPFVWATQTNQTITTGNVPLNRKTLLQVGSAAKDMCGVALTGLSANLVVRLASSLCGGSSANFSFVGTAVGQATPQVTAIELLDGCLIVPPGGVLALLATTTPAAHSAASGLVWEEVPV